MSSSQHLFTEGLTLSYLPPGFHMCIFDKNHHIYIYTYIHKFHAKPCRLAERGCVEPVFPRCLPGGSPASLRFGHCPTHNAAYTTYPSLTETFSFVFLCALLLLSRRPRHCHCPRNRLVTIAEFVGPRLGTDIHPNTTGDNHKLTSSSYGNQCGPLNAKPKNA